MAGNNKIDFKLYRYTPSRAAAVIFVVLFSLTTAYHVYQLTRRRAWYFLAFVIGGTFQIIGYICRVLAHDHKDSVPIYSVQTILILLAPPLYAASIYMVLGRLIIYLRAERLSIVPVRWMTKIFVTGDVVAFVMQAAGGGIMASGTVSSYNLGEHITVGGLCVQLAFFTFFMGTCALFHRRIRQSPTTEAVVVTARLHGRSTRSWEGILLGLYIASILILARSIFRLIEYAQGNDGFLISHEVFMYVFDSTLMVLTMVVINVFYPSIVLGRLQRERGEELDTPAVSETGLQE
ncbi:RTA1 domain-containing protein [Aspergillus fijiensis CBS 313.89]|uniref:Putative RTM1-like protein n=1 Tax=Aspergillus fijiensis CBS 313.89 TaxID=1448319 RepID=A0A8G1RW06_9EURO|nr:putative RTM1-like protein [Aspergillus fijiensis CBS 313.89]RAK81097.1 putative RTM1-like protein [Aspergillus fijiensis CBS 313.89]